MNNTPKPRRVAIRMRDFAVWIYRRSLTLMAFAGILQFALAIIVLFGFLIWEVSMQRQVKSTQSAGAAQTAGMQPDGNRSWVQTSTGLYFLRSPMSIVFGEEVTVQTRGEGSRYLCSQTNGCTRILAD